MYWEYIYMQFYEWLILQWKNFSKYKLLYYKEKYCGTIS